ncbi:MmcQ/YjbR family DNA-binding protein [Aeromicrobium sp.]|uniref:MmcQ/YjbR family DNA-binding protein n=1 Tax=Aeromicrobium sp. TaxID=1871063 RepID=UPI0030BB4023
MPDVALDVVERLRAICLGLPEAYEETAWTGVRWRVRTKTFAHVLVIDDGKPGPYARFVSTDGPVTVVTFRAPGEELEAFRQSPQPFFVARWGRDVVGLELHGDTDWDELGELLTDSFRVMAPQGLAARANLPTVQASTFDPTNG